jgi:site-specific DNA recombinase
MYRKILKDNKVFIVSVMKNLDNTLQSVLLRTLLEGMAEFYSLNLGQEIQKGFKENAYACKSVGGFAPLGNSVGDTGKYIVNEMERPIVELIFKLFLEQKELIYDDTRESLQKVVNKYFVVSLGAGGRNRRPTSSY